MKYSILSLAATAAIALGAASASAQVLMYSFETGDTPNAKDGFNPNGSGMTITQDTIGTTQGANSAKVVVAGAYVGDLTTSNVPAVLADPDLSAVTMDVTIPAGSPAFTGTSDDLGLVLFVGNVGEGEYGLQFGTTTEWTQIANLTGTTTITIPLIAPDPDSGTPESFATLLSKGWYVAGFELADDADAGQTFYVDNIEGVLPEPASISLIAVGALALGRRRKS